MRARLRAGLLDPVHCQAAVLSWDATLVGLRGGGRPRSQAALPTPLLTLRADRHTRWPPPRPAWEPPQPAEAMRPALGPRSQPRPGPGVRAPSHVWRRGCCWQR